MATHTIIVDDPSSAESEGSQQSQHSPSQSASDGDSMSAPLNTPPILSPFDSPLSKTSIPRSPDNSTDTDNDNDNDNDCRFSQDSKSSHESDYDYTTDSSSDFSSSPIDPIEIFIQNAASNIARCKLILRRQQRRAAHLNIDMHPLHSLSITLLSTIINDYDSVKRQQRSHPYRR